MCNRNTSFFSLTKDGYFIWEEWQQGLILSSYFFGLASTQLAGGRWAEKYSAKNVILLGTLISSAASLLVPIVKLTNWETLVFLQVVKGAGQVDTC